MKLAALLSLSTIGVLLTLTATPSFGQTSTAPAYNPDADPLQDVRDSDRRGSGAFGSSENTNTMMQLIHRAQMGPLRSQYEFRSDQQRGINDAASDFRSRQMQLLQPGAVQSPTTNQPNLAQPQ